MKKEGKKEKTARLFIAVDIPPEITGGIDRMLSEMKKRIHGVRWVKGDSIHLTLKFLGNVAEEKIEGIEEALEPVGSRHEAANLTVERLGAFPSMKRPRVIWLGIGGDVERLAALRNDVEEVCASLGFTRESRPFSPHLTIGRIRDAKKAGTIVSGTLKDLETARFEPFTVETFHLYRSELKPEGAVYTKLKTFSLGSEKSGRKQ